MMTSDGESLLLEHCFEILSGRDSESDLVTLNEIGRSGLPDRHRAVETF